VFGLPPSQDAILRRAVKPDFHCFQAFLRMFAALQNRRRGGARYHSFPWKVH
jgi:hypothetical protein